MKIDYLSEDLPGLRDIFDSKNNYVATVGLDIEGRTNRGFEGRLVFLNPKVDNEFDPEVCAHIQRMIEERYPH